MRRIKLILDQKERIILFILIVFVVNALSFTKPNWKIGDTWSAKVTVYNLGWMLVPSYSYNYAEVSKLKVDYEKNIKIAIIDKEITETDTIYIFLFSLEKGDTSGFVVKVSGTTGQIKFASNYPVKDSTECLINDENDLSYMSCSHPAYYPVEIVQWVAPDSTKFGKRIDPYWRIVNENEYIKIISKISFSEKIQYWKEEKTIGVNMKFMKQDI